MAREVTVLAPKPVDMSSITGTHAVEGEHQLPKSSSGMRHGVHARTCHLHRHIHKEQMGAIFQASHTYHS